MSKLPKIEEMVESICKGYTSANPPCILIPGEEIEIMMREYGRQVRDATLEWAAENAKVELHEMLEGESISRVIEIKPTIDIYDTQWVDLNQESILSGKISKDLEI